MRRLLALAVVVAVLCGCTPDAPGASGASSRVTAPDAVVAFPRTLQADRLVEARVLTVRDADTVVTSARLDSPLFAESPARDGEVRLFADWTNRVRLPLGTAVCAAGGPPSGPSTVVLTLSVDGEQTTETLAADDAALLKINADECAQQAVLDVAAPSFGAVESQTAAQLRTTIVLTRGTSMPDQPVTLESMTGNIVFIVTLADEPRTLAPGEASVAVGAVVSVGRCDPHVFAESKKTFVFPVRLALGDGEPAYVEFQPGLAAQAALQALFDACGAARSETVAAPSSSVGS